MESIWYDYGVPLTMVSKESVARKSAHLEEVERVRVTLRLMALGDLPLPTADVCRQLADRLEEPSS